jgi:flagellar basal body rod protein FlgC
VSELDLLAIAAGGMTVQRELLDVAARNVAAAQASTPERPYSRLVAHVAAAGDGDPNDPFSDPFDESGNDAAALHFTGATPGLQTADALTEMIAVLDAQRAYEANASVFDVGKKLAERTLDVGRF